MAAPIPHWDRPSTRHHVGTECVECVPGAGFARGVPLHHVHVIRAHALGIGPIGLSSDGLPDDRALSPRAVASTDAQPLNQ